MTSSICQIVHACFIFLCIAKKQVSVFLSVLYKHVKGALSVKYKQTKRSVFTHRHAMTRLMSFKMNDIRLHNAHPHEMKISLLEKAFFKFILYEVGRPFMGVTMLTSRDQPYR